MDRITISNLEVFGHHGVHPEENILGQKFLIDAVLFLDTRKAGLSDQLKDSVSYGEVIRLIRKEMTKQSDKLLERAAERLAEAVLLEYYDQIKSAAITVKKPWAPVMMHMDYAAVTITRGWHKAYVGAGSNLGDRKAWLNLARKRLSEERLIINFRSASVLETEPYGYVHQDNFLNTVYEFETLFTPTELLAFLHRVEDEAGRTREIRWGPRTLDLDLLLYDHLVTEEPELIIPHPELAKRLFVLEPLCELYPFGVHPVTRERFRDIKEKLMDLL